MPGEQSAIELLYKNGTEIGGFHASYPPLGSYPRVFEFAISRKPI
jgi:hypothetical protein